MATTTPTKDLTPTSTSSLNQNSNSTLTSHSIPGSNSLANTALHLATTTTLPSLQTTATATSTTTNLQTDNIGPIINKRSKTRPILLSADRRNRKRKSITWQSDEKIRKVHYFENIADERINVSRDWNQPSPVETVKPATNQAATEAAAKLSALLSSDGLKYHDWKLIPIDYTSDLPGPGWNSLERSAQAERELYVLGAIDLGSCYASLDEPDSHELSSGSSKNESGVKIIPLENPDGKYTVYPDIVSSIPPPSPSTTVSQFQAPYIDQIQQPMQAQQPAMFMNHQPGPIMPWLNYPFSQVSENSHVHLFWRPAT